MSKPIALMLAAVSLAFTHLAHAGGTGNWDIYSNALIQEGDDYWNVRIFDTPPDHTTVDMTGGSANGISTYDASTLNMSGGITEVTSLDQSIVNISGGMVYTIASWDTSKVNVSGGAVNSLNAWESSTVNISGEATVNGGVFAQGSATLNMMGGALGHLDVWELGTANLSGGSVYDSLWVGDAGIINVYGYDLAKVATGGSYGDGFVWGKWDSGEAFNFDFYGSDTYSRVVLIPEPSSLLLLTLGTFLTRRRK